MTPVSVLETLLLRSAILLTDLREQLRDLAADFVTVKMLGPLARFPADRFESAPIREAGDKLILQGMGVPGRDEPARAALLDDFGNSATITRNNRDPEGESFQHNETEALP